MPFDSREEKAWSQDEHLEQQRKLFAEIVEILINAGYFRARISTLSDFDKVVGGLCWCIVNSGEAVDVDILFKENSTTGERISLSEVIVKAMRGMGCPHPLQPHQIQGGIGGHDFGALKPVIVWLIKKFYERREEREQQLRAFSTLQFRKNYKFPTEAEVNEVSVDLSKVMGRNKVNREYRRISHAQESEETKVHSCLLEYGETLTVPGDGSEGNEKGGEKKGGKKKSGAVAVQDASSQFANLKKLGSDGNQLGRFEKQLMQEAARAEKEEAQYQEREYAEEKTLMKSMSELGEGEGLSVAGSNVGSLIGLGSSDISEASAAYLAKYEENQKAVDDHISAGKFGREASLKRQKQTLSQKQEELRSLMVKTEASSSAAAEAVATLETKKKTLEGTLEALQQRQEEIGAEEGKSSQKVELGRLKELVLLNENLRAQEASFKAGCKAQLLDMNERIKASASGAEEEQSEENKKLSSVEAMHDKVMSKYNSLRSVLAETNLEVSNSARVIDDIPTRSELIQYERRFVELYQQVAWKLEETRKYYAMYNTLDSSLGFLQKNVKILNSVTETFDEAMKTLQGKEEFMRSMENIIKGVDQSLSGQEEQLALKESSLDQLRTSYQTLVDEQRAYYTAIKDFQAECDKNEWLMDAMEKKKQGTL